MLALSIVTLVIAVIAVVFAMAAASAVNKLRTELENQREAIRLWKISFCEVIESRLLSLKVAASAPSPMTDKDTPAFARNLSDGPSGHIFHGHPEHVRPLNPVLS